MAAATFSIVARNRSALFFSAGRAAFEKLAIVRLRPPPYPSGGQVGIFSLRAKSDEDLTLPPTAVGRRFALNRSCRWTSSRLNLLAPRLSRANSPVSLPIDLHLSGSLKHPSVSTRSRSGQQMSRQRLIMLCVLWTVAAAGGVIAMLDFELTPAPHSRALSTWPTQSSIPLELARPTGVMFLHPHCPCSQASLAELKIVASACSTKAALHVVLVKPAGVDGSWERTSLADAAMKIPGVRVRCDADGREAALFGATTSGEMMLFAPNGRRLFDGGITVSRGHEGDNTGLTILRDLICSGSAEGETTPVYGCSLFSPCSDLTAP